MAKPPERLRDNQCMGRWLIITALAGIVAACGPSVPVDLPPGVTHRMTPAEVEDVVLDEIVRDTAQADLDEAVPTKLLKVTLVGQAYRMAGGGISMMPDIVTWAVDFQGIAVTCTSTCFLHRGAGTYIVADGSHEIRSGGFDDGVPCPAC